MLSLTRETQMDKARRTLRDAVSQAEEIVRDERLRADIRAAAGHGAKASEQVKKSLDDGGSIATRLASDKKMRKNLRAMLDDLEDASDRVRGKKRHRVRNALLAIVATVAALAIVSKVRTWLSGRPSTPATDEPAPLV
jgi:hypothetical protein